MSGLGGGGGWNGKGIPAMRSACVGRCQSSLDPGAGWTWRLSDIACAEGARGREGGPSLSRRQPACPSIGGERPMQGKFFLVRQSLWKERWFKSTGIYCWQERTRTGLYILICYSVTIMGKMIFLKKKIQKFHLWSWLALPLQDSLQKNKMENPASIFACKNLPLHAKNWNQISFRVRIV